MYGVPRNLKLKPFVGATLRRVEPLENVFYFTFERPSGLARKLKGQDLQIGVEGAWELRNPDGSVAVRGEPIPAAQSPYPLGRKVAGSEVRAPRSFILRFETGEELEVFDSSSEVESFSIPQQNVYV
jgi:hypothetical protein